MEAKIKPRKNLKGDINISGSITEATLIMATSLLTDEITTIKNVADCLKNQKTAEMIEFLGGEVQWSQNDTIKINPQGINSALFPPKITKSQELTFIFLGLLTQKFGKSSFPKRDFKQINIQDHLELIQKMGFSITEEKGFWKIQGGIDENKEINLPQARIDLAVQALLTAVQSRKMVTINNFPQDPEIQELIIFLNQMGADISCNNKSSLNIQVKKDLKGKQKNLSPDLEEAVFWIIMATLTQSEFKLKGVQGKNLMPLFAKIENWNLNYKILPEELVVWTNHQDINSAQELTSSDYPGLRPEWLNLMAIPLTQFQGESKLSLTRIPDTLSDLQFLKSLGAEINFLPREEKPISPEDPLNVHIFGPTKLIGSQLKCTENQTNWDRLLTALSATGETLIQDFQHLVKQKILTQQCRNLGISIEIENEAENIKSN